MWLCTLIVILLHKFRYKGNNFFSIHTTWSVQKIKKSTSYANVAAPGGAVIVVLIQHYSKIEIKWNKQILPRFYVLILTNKPKTKPPLQKGGLGDR